MAIFGHSKFRPVFLGKIQNTHFWPFQIYTSHFGKNCQKKFATTIFGHSEFIPVFLGKIVGKICNNHFWPFQIYTSLFGKIVRKNSEWPYFAILNLYQSLWGKLSEKFRMAIFGHSKFIPVFLGKIWNSHFGHFEFIPVFLEKIVRKISEWPFQIYLSIGKNCQKKFGMAIFGHSKFFLTIFLYILL